jgi:hypothetical protein
MIDADGSVVRKLGQAIATCRPEGLTVRAVLQIVIAVRAVRSSGDV